MYWPGQRRRHSEAASCSRGLACVLLVWALLTGLERGVAMVAMDCSAVVGPDARRAVLEQSRLGQRDPDEDGDDMDERARARQSPQGAWCGHGSSRDRGRGSSPPPTTRVPARAAQGIGPVPDPAGKPSFPGKPQLTPISTDRLTAPDETWRVGRASASSCWREQGPAPRDGLAAALARRLVLSEPSRPGGGEPPCCCINGPNSV